MDSLLARFLACMLVIRFTSGATPADFIEVSMTAGYLLKSSVTSGSRSKLTEGESFRQLYLNNVGPNMCSFT